MPQEWYPQNRIFDLREELRTMLYGDQDNPGIGQQVLIRRLLDRHCACWDGLRGSPKPDCRYCQGEGWQFIETANVVYIARNFGSVLNPSSVIMRQQVLAPYGLTDENRALGFAEFDVFPNYERYLKPEHPSYDKVYELKVDADGELIQPVIRTAKWKISSITTHRGDNGAPQYHELGLEKINV
jgi:hypothetical protein